jgi:hypothetical protein
VHADASLLYRPARQFGGVGHFANIRFPSLSGHAISQVKPKRAWA